MDWEGEGSRCPVETVICMDCNKPVSGVPDPSTGESSTFMEEEDGFICVGCALLRQGFGPPALPIQQDMLRAILSDNNCIVLEGFEAALLGIGEISSSIIAVYDRKKVLDILMSRDKMTFQEAEEWFEFNITGAYVGSQTPCFLTKTEDLVHDKDKDWDSSRDRWWQ